MQNLVSVFLVALCASVAFSQECQVVNFVAEALDTIRFTHTLSFHDLTNLRGLYRDFENEDEWTLLDYAAGMEYIHFSNGSCTSTHYPDYELPADLGASSPEVAFSLEDNTNGMTGTGVITSSGPISLKIVLDPECRYQFFSLARDAEAYVAWVFWNHQTENADISPLEEARELALSGACDN